MKYMMQHGIEPDRIRLSQDGSYEPYSQRDEPLFRDMNSRVEIFAISELARGLKDSVEERAGNFVEAHTVAQPAHDDHGHGEKKAESGHGAKSDGHGGGHGAKTDAHGAKADSHGAKADSHGSKPAAHGEKKESGHGAAKTDPKAKAGGHGAAKPAAPAEKKSGGHGH
jgi:hypothetical protein